VLTKEELIVGESYQSEKYKWILKILCIGKKRVFAYRESDDIEASWEISLLMEDFIKLEKDMK